MTVKSNKNPNRIYKGIVITKLFPSGYYEAYSNVRQRFLSFDDLGDAKAMIDSETHDTGIEKADAPRPNVKEPLVWSWNVRTIVSETSYTAMQHLIDSQHPQITDMENLRLMNEYEEALNRDDPPGFKHEVYDSICHFISRSRGATPRERAEAKLLTWIRLYEP